LRLLMMMLLTHPAAMTASNCHRHSWTLPSSASNTTCNYLLPGAKTDSKSPASSMSASRTSQCKRKELRAASDSWIAAAEDLYCAVECLMDER